MEDLIKNRVANFNWGMLTTELSASGFGLTGPILTVAECEELISLYAAETNFRSKIVMERFRFGKGDYQYFRKPLPKIVEQLRESTYQRLAKLANEWRLALNDKAPAFPPTHQEFLDRCRRAGQNLPTPLVLHYEAGGYNCLHQDLYGEIAFPLQLTCFLSEPGRDYSGGEFLLLEQRPRAQSKGEAITARQGEIMIFTTRYRPAQGTKGYYRVNIRHAVSRMSSGVRYTLGIIFHDAK